MNVRWCALSGGGCSSGGVSSVVCAATHDVCLGCAGLMAGLARGAGGAVVTNFDLVIVCSAVPNFVPRWFGVTPVGGANTGLRQWGRRCCCVRGQCTGHAHLCNGELDV
jgi:hypothetical protein